MIVAIHAFENTYGGLHGIENHRIIEVDTLQQAESIAMDDSREVMDSYEDIMEDFYSEAEDEGLERDSEEFEEYIAECVNDNIGYQIWEVVDQYDTLEVMEEDFYNSRDEFVKEHCRELV